jgi:hypothetical protein
MNRTTIIAGLLAGVLATPTTAPAGPAAETAVRIEVDVSALPKADFPENTRRWIVDNQTAVLEREGFVVRDDASHGMRIEVSRYGEDGIHTKARLMLVGDPSSVREITCEACLNSQFLKKVDEETAVLAGALRQRLAATEPEPASEPGPATETETEGAAADVTEGHEARATSDKARGGEGRAVGGAGYAGIAALSAGFGLTLGGIAVVTEDPTRRSRPDHDKDFEVVDRKPLGAGLTAVGAALLVSGAVLLTVDQTVLRRRRNRRAQASIVAPIVSPAALGFSWTTRF